MLRKDVIQTFSVIQQRWAAWGSGQDTSPCALGTANITHTHKEPFPTAASCPCLPTMTSRPCKHFHITTCYVTAWLTVKSQECNWGNKHHLAKTGSNRHLCVAIQCELALSAPQCMRFSVVGLASCTEEAMAADKVRAEASSVFLQQPLHFFI